MKKLLFIGMLLITDCTTEHVKGSAIITGLFVGSVVTGTNLMYGAGSGSRTYGKNADKEPCLQYLKSPQPHQKKENWDLLCEKYENK